MEPIIRKYRVADPNMLEHNKTMRAHFLDEQSEFEGFDIGFATPFETNWLSAIDAAEAILPDEVIKDQLQQLTAAADDAMEAARLKFASTKYFVERAFPTKPAIQQEFGTDDFRDVRRSQTGMTQFMQTLFKTATKYTVQLAAVGFDAAAVAEINTLAIALNIANIEQEKFKGTRLVTTEQRVVVHNEAWDVMVRVSKAGKLIFLTDPAKYQLFLLPASSESGEDISISGKVSALGGAAIEGATVRIVSLNLETSTDSNGNYVFGNLPDGTYTLDFEAAGFVSASGSGVVVAEGETAVLNVELVASGGGGGATTTLGGKVQDNLTLMPIAGASVSLTWPGGSLNVLTDVGGNYGFSLASVTTTLSGSLDVSAAGYSPAIRPVVLTPSASLTEDFLLNPAP